jgi:hypothetical protein
MSYGVSAPPGTVTVRAPLPPSFTPRVRAGLARLAAQGLGKLQPSDRTEWLAAIRCLDVGSLTAIPCRHARRTHSRDEAADLTATTGQAGTCWTSAKRLDSEDSGAEPRHQSIGCRFIECWRSVGSLGRGMQASGDWANLPTATGPIAAVPCPRLHGPGSRRGPDTICRAGARFEPGDGGRTVIRDVRIRLVAIWMVASQGLALAPI